MSRQVGSVQGGIYLKKEKESGKLRMSGGSWTIKVDEVQHDHIKGIVFTTSKHTYSIDKDHAFKIGFVKMLGGELKLIVPVKHWLKT